MSNKTRFFTVSRLLPLTVLASIWIPSSQSVASYPMTLPWRGDALEPNVYFRSNGHTGSDYGNPVWGMDLHAAKWVDPDWQTNDGGNQNTDEYIFGVDLYSPIDGEIVACWRTAPDKPSPTLDYDLDGDGVFGEAKNCVVSGDVCEDDSDCFAIWPQLDSCGSGHDRSPMAAGNHLQIRNEAGDFVVFLAHMQSGSIPAELCPLPANRDDQDTTSSPGDTLVGPDGWPDVKTDTCTETDEGFPQDTILPTPVPVKQGQFIGRVGHSGASSRPHLHMHAKPIFNEADGDYCVENSEEMLFSEAWAQECETGNAPTGGWSPLDIENPVEPYDIGGSCDDDTDCVGDEVCSSEGQCVVVKPGYCFLPDAIGPQEDHDDYNIPATNLHFTTHTDGDVLVYQSSGALRLRSYDLDSFGVIQAQDTHDEGSVLDVAVARPNSSRDVIVSVRGSNGVLKHIPYDVATVSGTIVRMVGKEWTDSTVLQVESTTSPEHAGFVVAVETSSGNLKVIDYHVTAGLDITRDLSSDGTGGAIDDLAITTMGIYEGVVTAEIDTGGDLNVRSFDVPLAGGVTNADTWTTNIDGDSVTIDRVPTSFGNEYFVTSVIRDSGALRLDSWEVDDFGTISLIDSYEVGVVSQHDGTAGTTMSGDFVVGMRDSADEFRMIGWDVNIVGELRRNSTRDLGDVTQTAISTSFAGGGNHLVAARTDGAGDLHLYVYGENYSGWY